VEPFKEAIAAFEESIHLQPQMPDPYIGMGAALIKLKTAAGLGWVDQAERALRRALDLNPTNGKACYYLGKLALRRALEAAAGTDARTEALAEARRYLDNGDAHPWQQYLLAQVVGRYQEPPDTALAVRLLDRSILSLRRADDRFESLCEMVLANPTSDERTLRHARDVAVELEAGGLTDALKARGKAFVAALDQRLAELANGTAPAPPAAGSQTTPTPVSEAGGDEGAAAGEAGFESSEEGGGGVGEEGAHDPQPDEGMVRGTSDPTLP